MTEITSETSSTDEKDIDPLKDATPEEQLEVWLKRISHAEKDQDQFISDGRTVSDLYYNKKVSTDWYGTSVGKITYNLLWEVVQIVKPALYAKIPTTEVRAYCKGDNDVYRVATMMSENALDRYLRMNKSQVHETLTAAVLDLLLPGRGQLKINYSYIKGDVVEDTDPTEVDEVSDEVQEVEAGIPEEAEGEEGEEIPVKEEEIEWEYVPWTDFLHDPSNAWSKTGWVAFKWRLTKREFHQRFPEIDMSKVGEGSDASRATRARVRKAADNANEKDAENRIIGWEIWDKVTEKIYYISEQYQGGPLEVSPPAVELDGFFPCPRPLLATCVTDSLIPKADYMIFRELAEDVNEITKRTSEITKRIRAVGIYNAAMGEDIANMLDMQDGRLHALKNWQRVTDNGGLKENIEWAPFQELAQTVQVLQGIRDQKLNEVYELLGISDLMRGDASPYQTAEGTQTAKTYSGARLYDKQFNVQSFVRDALRITFDLMMNHFSDDAIIMLSGANAFRPEDQQFVPQAMALLRDGRLVDFEIDIETDSLIRQDDEQNKAARGQLIQSVGGMFQTTFQLAQMKPELLPIMLNLVSFATAAFPDARVVKQSIDNLAQQIQQDQAQQAAQAAQQPPQPDPEMLKVQHQAQVADMKNQIAEQKMQSKAQLDQWKAQSEVQIQQYLTQNQITLAQQKLEAEYQIKMAKLEAESQAKEKQLYIQAAQAAQTAQQPPAAPAAPAQPIVQVHNYPPAVKTRIATYTTDPNTGQRVAVIRDVPDIPTEDAVGNALDMSGESV